MKKILILIMALLSIVVISCDRLYECDFYIINNCNQSILVSRTNSWDDVNTQSVDSNSMILFIEGGGITSIRGITNPKGVLNGWKKLEVTKNGVLSKVNYLDFSRWIYEQTTDKYHSKMYLHVNPEDFE